MVRSLSAPRPVQSRPRPAARQKQNVGGDAAASPRCVHCPASLCLSLTAREQPHPYCTLAAAGGHEKAVVEPRVGLKR